MKMDHTTFERDGAIRAVVPGKQVRVTGEATRVTPPRQPGECEPQIDLIRNGGQIRAIDIRCACGSRIYLECEY
jgi:hypothetical protein